MDIPRDLDAERGLLGSLLMAGHLRTTQEQRTLLRVVSQIAPPQDWWDIRNRNIYKAILDCDRNGKPVDTIFILQALKTHGLQDVEVATYALYLRDAWQTICTCEHAEGYAESIHDCALRRGAIQRAQQTAQEAYEGKRSQARGIEI